ncbi:hypothetical protein [Erythrobacter donghaensis]|uniref:hypothetical protein n=1 Tax=Erythrobacter donghaensis TaxID=267135 RepID=UPI000A3833C8|nr:hypothetical protein [Erythrobacter donghaensis]
MITTSKAERLFLRADAIMERRANGFAMPVLEHLALRGYAQAMLELARWDTRSGDPRAIGRICDTRSPAALMRLAHRLGDITAAQNLAMTLFHAGDLAGYRHWLRRAARAGDAEAGAELRRFEVRQPFSLARRIGRIRPLRRSERRAYQS